MESWLNGNKRILIITGAVNSGKTTLANKIADEFKDFGFNVKGFLSKGIFSGEDKTGYKLINISTGDEYHLASINPGKKFKLRQGRLFFNEEVFETADKLLKHLSTDDIILLDEIGPLEIKEKGFYSSLKEILSSLNNKVILIVREKLIKDILTKFNLLRNEIDIIRIEN